MRIVFLGSDAIALPLLRWLAGSPRHGLLTAVFTQPDRPAGRGQRAAPNAIKMWAQERGVPVLQPDRLREPEEAALRALAPDVSLVMAYGHILRDGFIAVPRLGTLNVHASMLPAYRGASPIQTAVASGETETGATLMRIVRELDAGPVADAERVKIGPEDTAADVEDRLARACVMLLDRALPLLEAGSLRFLPQDAARATYCRKLTKADGVLDFTQSAAVLAGRINGLFPWPGCGAAIRGDSIRFAQARAETAGSAGGANFPAGAVLASDSSGLRVATGAGVLRILRLQRPGGRLLPAGDFLRGFPVPAGTVLESLPMPPLVSTRPFKH